MQKVILSAAAALALVAGSAQAAFVYYDVDATNTVDASTGTYNNWDLGADAAPGWRFRNTGPGAPAFNTTAYTGQWGLSSNTSSQDPSLLTNFTGLAPNTEYNVRVYGVFPNNSTARHFAAFSTDGGTTLDYVDNRDGSPQGGAATIVLPHPLVWVDNSNGGLGGTPGARGTADARFYAQITQTITSDGAGNGSILLVLPLNNPGHPTLSGGFQDRFNLDGYALAVVPEPTMLSLLSLGGFALLGRRRQA